METKKTGQQNAVHYLCFDPESGKIAIKDILGTNGQFWIGAEYYVMLKFPSDNYRMVL